MSKTAVCVGINDYPAGIGDLRGCVNDADDWASLLMGSHGFTSITKLIDSDATVSAITDALASLVDSANAGNVAVFTFSGHGTWEFDNPANPDESDNRDEALCAHDGNILDDKIRTILNTLNDTARLTVISDSCHSGTVTRTGRSARVTADMEIPGVNTSRPRFMPPQDDARALKGLLLPVRRRVFYPESNMPEVLLTGCNALQYSYDAYINGRFNGAMSALAIQLIRVATPTTTYRTLHGNLRRLLPSNQFPQSPQLEGPDHLKDAPLFT